MSLVSRLRSLFEKRGISVSDERSSDAEVTVQRTVASYEQERSSEGLAEDSGTALNSSSPEPTALQMAEQQDWEVKQLKVWQKGDVIMDRYQVEDVKAGGMGYVYIAEHKNWNVKMAIKSPNQMMLSNRFLFSRVLREADSWIELGLHPHIAYCYYVLQIEDVPHIFIEYVDGGSLREWIADRRCYDLKIGLDLAIQFCHGMGYAHKHGMIHRDIKPGNLLMTKEGILKITDFGIAKTQEAERRQKYTQVSHQKWAVSDGQLTTVNTIIGSADYMSPEQWEDPSHVDARADIYSFGVCMYSMFCDVRPYESTSIEAKRRGRKPYDPLKLRKDIPHPLADLLRKSVALESEERVHSCEELRGELLRIYRNLFQEEPPHAELKTIGLRADSLNNRAVSYVELGKGREAMELWDEALREDPRHPEATYNRGVVLWRRGHLTDKALADQLELSGSGAGWLANYLLALVHLERGDINSAMPLLETLAQQVPEEPEVQSALRLAQSDGIFACGPKRIFEGHMNEVNSICLSADGRYALLGSRGNILQLWDATTGEYVRTFEGHTNEVTSVYLSADGRYALSGSKDKTLRLWDAATGECLQTLRGHENEVTSVSLSGDAQYALSGSFDKTLRLWNMSTGECMGVYWRHTEPVTSVYLSADSRYMLSGSKDKTLRFWDVATGKCVQTLEGHEDEVTSVSLSSDAQYALSGSFDKTLRLWHTTTGKCLRTYWGHTEAVTSVYLSADSQYALSGGKDKTVRLWDVSTGKCRHTFELHTDEVTSVSLSGDGQYALSGSFDKTLRLWELSLGKTNVFPLRLSRSRSHAELAETEVQAEELLKRGEEALETGRFADALSLVRQARDLPGHGHTRQSLETWRKLSRVCSRANLRAVWHVETLDGHVDAVTSVSLSADGRYALSGSFDKTLRLWNWDATESQRVYAKDWLNAVGLSPDGRYALSGSADETLQLWDMTTGRCLRIFEGHTGPVYSVSLSADGRYALSGSRDNSLRLWDVATGKCLLTFEEPVGAVYSVSLSADARYALSGSFDKTLRLWDVTTGLCLHTFKGHTGAVTSVSLSADGRYALSGSFDKTLRLWDVTKGGCLHIFQGHTGVVTSVSVSADSRYALSGSRDKTLRLWDMATGRCLQILRGHKDDVTSACLSSDGCYIMSGSKDCTLRLWALDWELEAREPADWDEDARPYLESFLTRRTPHVSSLPERGGPVWSEEDFQELIRQLQHSGYGWLRPEGVRRKLERMAAEWQ